MHKFTLEFCIFQEKLALEQGTERTFALEVLESIYRFALGSIAGGELRTMTHKPVLFL